MAGNNKRTPFSPEHAIALLSALMLNLLMTAYSQNPQMFKGNPLGFIGCILLIPVAGLGLFILFYWYLVSRTTKFTITDKEVLFEKGILNKEHSEIALSSVRSVKVKQSLINRIFDVGTIEIYTAGDRPEIVAAGLPDPKRLRELIN